MPEQDDPRRGRNRQQKEPAPGCAEPGQEYNPSDAPDDSQQEERSEQPVPAPAPGVPVSEHEYQRLKEDARRRRKHPDVPAQEDRPRKKD
jgi:hypothetical protein